MTTNKRGAGRPPGALNTRTEDLQKRFMELSTPELFAQVFQSLVNVAIQGEREADRVNASKYLIDRWLGKVPEVVNVLSDSQSVGDVLAALRASAHQKSSGDVVSHSREGEE